MIPLLSARCKDGRDGINGLNGKDGINGKDGKDGKDGINGKDGKDGINGKDGEMKQMCYGFGIVYLLYVSKFYTVTP